MQLGSSITQLFNLAALYCLIFYLGSSLLPDFLPGHAQLFIAKLSNQAALYLRRNSEGKGSMYVPENTVGLTLHYNYCQQYHRTILYML